MRLNEAIQAFLKSLADRAFARKTLSGYGEDLKDFLTFTVAMKSSELLVSEITPFDLEAFLSKTGKEGKRPSAAYRNRRLSALRSFFRYLGEQGELQESGNPTKAIHFARLPRTEPSFLSYEEYLKILREVSFTANLNKKLRDWAVISTLYNSGLRLSEIVSLDLSQFNGKEALFVGLKRKGGIIRDLPVNMNVVRSVSAWLKVRGIAPGPLFTAHASQRISARAIQRMVRIYAKSAGIQKPVTPHTFRHSHCTEIQKRGASISTAKRLMDHQSIKTTARYSHTDDDSLRLAVAALNDSATWPEFSFCSKGKNKENEDENEREAA